MSTGNLVKLIVGYVACETVTTICDIVSCAIAVREFAFKSFCNRSNDLAGHSRSPEMPKAI